MITIKLYQRTEGKDKTSGFIYVSFYVNRQKEHFSTKVQCLAKHWNADKMRISVADKQASDKNLILEKTLARVNDVIVKYRLRNKVLTRAAFKKSYNRPDDFDNFYAFCDEYKRKSVSNRVELATLATHTTVLHKLKAYSPELHFDDITLDFVVDFSSYLRKKVKNNENTTYKNLSVVRKYVKAACKAGYMDENPFDEFHILRTKANYTYLDESELLKLLKLYRNGDLELKHYKTLQFFLYMCFSSQHVGDAKAMKIEQFNDISFTYYRAKLRNSKPEPITVPMSSSLKKLLSEIVGHRKKGLVFENLPADQTMNRFLKEIVKMDNVEIKKAVTHKTGRHTFATFYLDKTKDMNTLRDILGHSDIRETLIYAHVLEKSKERSIKCFDIFK